MLYDSEQATQPWSNASYNPPNRRWYYDWNFQKLLDENPSPFMLNGKPSREFIFSYKATGKEFKTSVTLLDWSEREHLVVVITARSADYKRVHDAEIASLFSWSLRKSPDSTPSPAIAPKQ
jgi:hypothetical protein